jgi:hypothetical protein
VVTLVMAWSPARRSNAGRFEVEHPGDYAAFNSYQPGYGTRRSLNLYQQRHERVGLFKFPHNSRGVCGP